MATTPFAGALAPVTEEVTAYGLDVTGRIPAELNGRYLRNGPNPLSLGDLSATRLFVGEGMIHGVRLRDGRAEWYRNRWVRNAEVARRLGEQPRPGPVHAGMDFAANTHVIGLAGRTFATVEAGALPYELSYELDTIGPCDFDGGLPGGFAAHTHADPATGELHAVAYFYGWEHHQHLVIDPQGTVTQVRHVPIADAPMVHDFALTERYVVIYDLPVTFSMARAARGAPLPYAWNDAHAARLGLLSRATGEVRWFEVEPCWVFHTLNAYDDGDEVVVDVVRYPKRFVRAQLDRGGAPTLDRWRIDVGSGKVSETRLDDRPQEFPRMDERRTGRPYRYGYTSATADLYDAIYPTDAEPEDLPDEAFDNLLIKHDLQRGTQEARQVGRGAYVGEPLFVASGEAEDDGYVLSFVNNPARGAADLVILSGQDFTGDPVATIHLPARIPLGFHGSWIAD
ncbi:carotenoid oxygenase family protein [Nonomuraea sp. KC401]|uniref:carotenoid oxygenase family protein n=1 Tax=unclassified Nonomuraea TaxID=2593643 RepID=UPI0010FF3E53|nr:carotenoid oxygenase family protein [Nonomuraea sp. KC401]NBE96254.1 carotenoid oxygenase [Nonomuraea sp. K271]TLF70908.1 carotenoid oxygenase family protein [Nonomuraea sp. KC401]